jgi:hypothetical protein
LCHVKLNSADRKFNATRNTYQTFGIIYIYIYHFFFCVYAIRNFCNLLLVRVRSILMSLGWQHQNAFSFPHSSKVVRKSFGNCIPITYLPFRNGPDKSRQGLLRQAAENPEVIKGVGTSVVKDIPASVSKTMTSWQNMGNLGGYAVGIAGGCSASFTAFSYFSTLGQNVADLKSQTDRIIAQMDADNARFDKVFLGTLTLSLGVPLGLGAALLMIVSSGREKK